MQESVSRIDEILKILHDYQIEFIIVGGVCAVLHGSPVTTFDLDIVHSRTSENLERLMNALHDLNAYYRGHPKRLVPDIEYLSSSGHHLLMTRLGPMDVLGTIENNAGYDELFEFSEQIPIQDMKFRLLNFEYLVNTKKQSCREKDRLQLKILEHTLKEKQRL